MLRFRHAGPALLRVKPIHIRASTPSRIVTPAADCQTRSFRLQGLALAPALFGGLFVAMWTWKCFMLVIFQNKIIYMPGLPPSARWEKIEDYETRCVGIRWLEERVRAADGTNLALCTADINIGRTYELPTPQPPDIHYYILYFQGNAASIPPRLPDISSALSVLKRYMYGDPRKIRVTVICLSYRGYWKSRGRPTENGIRLDAHAALEWIAQHHKALSDLNKFQEARVLLWGQSIGSGVATNLAAGYSMPKGLCLDALILETPFTSIRDMLGVLYPQKWLPYKYLWPFLRNHLDSWRNIGVIAEKCRESRNSPHILILEAAKDELVPAELSRRLYDRCIEVGFPVEKKAVESAFHNDTMFRAEGRKAVADFIARRLKEVRV
ncbi:alpha/beta-hydrolase [Xylariales sp. PMI_506]|nr:alpha/beta-hydrolase [Xylariales sp. PMI_506]